MATLRHVRPTAVSSLPCTSAAFAELSAGLLRAGVALRFRARGTSMSPLVRDGDVVLVWPTDPPAVRVGDVVLCSSGPDRVLVHRVIDRRAGLEGVQFAVQGDCLARPDGWVPATHVYGRLAAIERAGTRIAIDGIAMRMLGSLAALRSRWNLGRSRRFRLARRLVKWLPRLSRYLA